MHFLATSSPNVSFVQTRRSMTKHPLLHLYQPVREQQQSTAGRTVFCCGAVCYQDNGVLCLFKDSITGRFITSKGQQRLKLHQGPDHTGSTLDFLCSFNMFESCFHALEWKFTMWGKSVRLLVTEIRHFYAKHECPPRGATWFWLKQLCSGV